jgi:hypothetical protein
MDPRYRDALGGATLKTNFTLMALFGMAGVLSGCGQPAEKVELAVESRAPEEPEQSNIVAITVEKAKASGVETEAARSSLSSNRRRWP